MIDFHCHLDLYPQPRQVAEESARRGVQVLSVTTTPSAWQGTLALADGLPSIRTALGLHPQLAHQRWRELPLFDKYLTETKYVGEIGIDGGPEYRRTLAKQVEVFEHVLQKCQDAGGRVMSIHSRLAAGKVLDCLQRYPRAGTPILHWFSGSFRELKRAIELGCWFSVGPAMLMSDRAATMLRAMPRENILTETDGPFAKMGERPFVPWDVSLSTRRFVEILNTSMADISDLLSENLRRIEAACRR